MTEEEWRRRLTPEQYRVLRRQGTEPPFSHPHALAKEAGVYRCAGCVAELFRADAKFDSGTGWPEFHRSGGSGRR
jgi:peptide-methionine (R)-S-oxide reductase